jgi:hypothetical protein
VVQAEGTSVSGPTCVHKAKLFHDKLGLEDKIQHIIQKLNKQNTNQK